MINVRSGNNALRIELYIFVWQREMIIYEEIYPWMSTSMRVDRTITNPSVLSSIDSWSLLVRLKEFLLNSSWQWGAKRKYGKRKIRKSCDLFEYEFLIMQFRDYYSHSLGDFGTRCWCSSWVPFTGESANKKSIESDRVQLINPTSGRRVKKNVEELLKIEIHTKYRATIMKWQSGCTNEARYAIHENAWFDKGGRRSNAIGDYDRRQQHWHRRGPWKNLWTVYRTGTKRG